MKPIKAVLFSVYSEIDPNLNSKHYIRFQVAFANHQQGYLLIETDKNHRHAIASHLELFRYAFPSTPQLFGYYKKEFQPWEENSWQDALLNAWLRYTSVTGYCVTTMQQMPCELVEQEETKYRFDWLRYTKVTCYDYAAKLNIVFELQEQQDNKYCYELSHECKKHVCSMLPRGTIINEDGIESEIIITPQEIPDLFNEPKLSSDHANGTASENSETLFNCIDFQIISGFMMIVGAAAVTVAFAVLNAASLGITGLAVGGLGVAAVLTGIGIFKTGYDRNYSEPKQLQENGLAY